MELGEKDMYLKMLEYGILGAEGEIGLEAHLWGLTFELR